MRAACWVYAITLAAAVTACAGDVAAERAGTWLADQPHVARVLDDHAIRQGELSAAADPRAVFVEAELDAGTRPADLVGLPGSLRQYLDSSRVLDGLSVRLHGDDFVIDLHGDLSLDRRRIDAAQVLLDLPHVTHVDLTEATRGGGPVVSSDGGNAGRIAPAVFEAASSLVDAENVFRGAVVSGPGQATVRTETARRLSGAAVSLLERLARLPGAREIVVGPTEAERSSDWVSPVGETSSVERPGLPADADVMSVRFPTARAAAEIRDEALGVVARSDSSTQLTVRGGDLALVGDDPLDPTMAQRLVALASDDVAVDWKGSLVEVELPTSARLEEAVGRLPATSDVRLSSRTGSRIELQGPTTEVRRVAEIALASGLGGDVDDLLGIRSAPGIVELSLGTGYGEAFERFAHETRRRPPGGPVDYLVRARVTDRSGLVLRFRSTPEGSAQTAAWDLASSDEADREAVDRAARELLATWDATA